MESGAPANRGGSGGIVPDAGNLSSAASSPLRELLRAAAPGNSVNRRPAAAH